MVFAFAVCTWCGVIGRMEDKHGEAQAMDGVDSSRIGHSDEEGKRGLWMRSPRRYIRR